LFPWNAVLDAKLEPKPAPKDRRDPLKLARYYQSQLDSGKFENRAALARYLGVSRPRVTQVLRRLGKG
jgi:Mn-dependent DtxR family transcriptional regulator